MEEVYLHSKNIRGVLWLPQSHMKSIMEDVYTAKTSALLKPIKVHIYSFYKLNIVTFLLMMNYIFPLECM